MPVISTGTASALAKRVANKPKNKPVWGGPCGEGPQGGVTQSLLARYLGCPERFRIITIEGLRGSEHFSAPLEFGNMWHACEEGHATGIKSAWINHLQVCCGKLLKKYPRESNEIDVWFQKCQVLFPKYVEHWAAHPDVQKRTPLMQEQAFDVPYKLPSGRTVRLRGKFDSVDLIEEKPVGVYLQENKSKSGIDQAKVFRQLRFDNQTMIYLIALETMQKAVKGGKIIG